MVANGYKIIALSRFSANDGVHIKSPSTQADWKSTSGHTVQNGGVQKAKLTRCRQKRCFNHLKRFFGMPA